MSFGDAQTIGQSGYLSMNAGAWLVVGAGREGVMRMARTVAPHCRPGESQDPLPQGGSLAEDHRPGLRSVIIERSHGMGSWLSPGRQLRAWQEPSPSKRLVIRPV